MLATRAAASRLNLARLLLAPREQVCVPLSIAISIAIPHQAGRAPDRQMSTARGQQHTLSSKHLQLTGGRRHLTGGHTHTLGARMSKRARRLSPVHAQATTKVLVARAYSTNHYTVRLHATVYLHDTARWCGC